MLIADNGEKSTKAAASPGGARAGRGRACRKRSDAMSLAAKWRFIHRGIKARHIDHRAELRALLGALSHTDVAVDVGAHKGSFVWPLSRAVPKGHVVAFEPQPFLASYLRRACRSAHLDNVFVEGVGVSDRSGLKRLAIIEGGTHSHGASFEVALAEREPCRFIDVPVVSLDDYFSDQQSKIGAIKIDVEGHELSVLKGAVAIIAAYRPTILCEAEDRHKGSGTVATVLDFMANQNYNSYFFMKSKLRPVSEFDQTIHQRDIGGRFWNAADYCNSFLFTSRPIRADRTKENSRTGAA
jgi:FkbM family methyltransferase